MEGDLGMLTWDDSLCLGVSNIDRQHMELFTNVNNLLTSMKKGNAENSVNDMMDFLERYVIFHFNEEETLQKKSNYPLIKEHLQQHADFRKNLTELKSRIQASGINTALTIDIQNYMCNWWINHIRNYDMELGKYLNSLK